MGSLKPGATYIYERANGVTYAREMGKTERTVIGYDADAIVNSYNPIWKDILEESKVNPTLQKALERVIMLYRLSKDNPL
jgi:hypothetical protein